MRSASPVGPDVRPPDVSNAAPPAGEAPFRSVEIRRTVETRPLMTVTLVKRPYGIAPTELYVRRFWSAALGVAAVADLLRITEAGRRGAPIRRPLYLQPLLRAGLAHIREGSIVVGDRVPLLPPHEVNRLHPEMRRAHARWISSTSATAGPPDGEPESH